MQGQENLAVILGAILSFVLQFLKRWYTFTPNAVKGFVILVSIAYAVVIGLVNGTFTFWGFVTNLGAFLVGNQALYALILNNTETGAKLAGDIPEDY